MKQTFAEIAKIATDYHAEVDNTVVIKTKSALTEKYFDRLFKLAIKNGERWAMS